MSSNLFRELNVLSCKRPSKRNHVVKSVNFMDKLVTVSTCKDLLQHPLNQTTKICLLSCCLIKPKCPEGILDNTRSKFKHRARV